jgi:hypothetical protein
LLGGDHDVEAMGHVVHVNTTAHRHRRREREEFAPNV